MGSGIYIAAAGARAQSDRLDITANNIANATTSGFKAQKVSFGEALGNAQSPDASYVTVGTVAEDRSAGTLEDTGNPLDIALVGDGYYAVDTPAGVRYSRSGGLRVANDGRLVNELGLPLRDIGGGNLQIPPDAVDVRIDGKGAVSADGVELGRMQLARFAPDSTVREGANLVRANGRPLAGQEPEVVSGALESSNVNIVHGMVEMVETSRTYESLLKMIEGYRQVENRAARDLGSP